jgi:ribosomal protein L37AE/L43A
MCAYHIPFYHLPHYGILTPESQLATAHVHLWKKRWKSMTPKLTVMFARGTKMERTGTGDGATEHQIPDTVGFATRHAKVTRSIDQAPTVPEPPPTRRFCPKCDTEMQKSLVALRNLWECPHCRTRVDVDGNSVVLGDETDME